MSIENYTSKEAQEKMTKLVEDIKFTMLLTDLNSQPISAIPMTTKKVDEKGDIWFLSGLNSDHNRNIVQSRDVQLLYSDPNKMEYISIYGEATVVTEKNILEELYSKQDDAYFTGVDDPNLTALKIVPREAYYWDTKQNKYMELFKMGIAALTGDQKDVGEKGRLDL